MAGIAKQNTIPPAYASATSFPMPFPRGPEDRLQGADLNRVNLELRSSCARSLHSEKVDDNMICTWLTEMLYRSGVSGDTQPWQTPNYALDPLTMLEMQERPCNFNHSRLINVREVYNVSIIEHIYVTESVRIRRCMWRVSIAFWKRERYMFESDGYRDRVDTDVVWCQGVSMHCVLCRVFLVVHKTLWSRTRVTDWPNVAPRPHMMAHLHPPLAPVPCVPSSATVARDRVRVDGSAVAFCGIDLRLAVRDVDVAGAAAAGGG